MADIRRGDERAHSRKLPIPSRHPDLFRGPSCPTPGAVRQSTAHTPTGALGEVGARTDSSALAAKWALKQVQGDEREDRFGSIRRILLRVGASERIPAGEGVHSQ